MLWVHRGPWDGALSGGAPVAPGEAVHRSPTHSFAYTQNAERAPSLGSIPERPGSPPGAHWHRQGVPQLHEEADPALGPAVAAGGSAPRAEAEGSAKGPETGMSRLQGGGVVVGRWRS